MLALRIGTLHVERDVLSLKAREFHGWELFEEIYPMVSENRMDHNFASVLQMLYNINRGEKQKALPLQDFILEWGKEAPKQSKTVVLAPSTGRTQTLDEQLNILKALAAMHANDQPPLPKVIEDAPASDTPKG